MNLRRLSNNPEITSSFICGVVIWALAAISCFATPLAPMMIMFLFLVPGLAFCTYCLYLKHSKKNAFVFILLGGALYFSCFLLIDLKDDSRFTPTLFLSSTLGSCGLFLLYYLLISDDYPFFKTLIFAILNGIISAAPSAFSHYLFVKAESAWAFAGIYSIYFFGS